MFTLTLRDYLKCAHSLKGDIFGPAQLMHVITYEVEVKFVTPQLDEHGLIVDFAGAQSGLQELLGRYKFKNLDEIPELNGINTTTEWLCQHIQEELVQRMQGIFKGELEVILRESPVAWTSYKSTL